MDRGDDGAALLVAGRFRDVVSVIMAGRPGAGLLELLPPDQGCILLDVTSSGAPAGTLHRFALDELNPATLPDAHVSSHGFGPSEALDLGRTLGRPLPQGYFIGIEGGCYDLGSGLSPAVEEALPRFEGLVREALRRAVDDMPDGGEISNMTIPLLTDIVVILGLSLVVVLLLQRARLPLVLGFLLTGIVAGPHGLGLIKAVHEVEILAEVALRAEYGITLLAVRREGQTLPNPAAAFRIEIGNLLIVFGGPREVADAAALARGSDTWES